jgi:hypothetical protein
MARHIEIDSGGMVGHVSDAPTAWQAQPRGVVVADDHVVEIPLRVHLSRAKEFLRLEGRKEHGRYLIETEDTEGLVEISLLQMRDGEGRPTVCDNPSYSHGEEQIWSVGQLGQDVARDDQRGGYPLGYHLPIFQLPGYTGTDQLIDGEFRGF